MYFADIASSLYFGLENCAGWGAQTIMAEIAGEGNVENRPYHQNGELPPLLGIVREV
jgi:hypothetical protein